MPAHAKQSPAPAQTELSPAPFQLIAIGEAALALAADRGQPPPINPIWQAACRLEKALNPERCPPGHPERRPTVRGWPDPTGSILKQLGDTLDAILARWGVADLSPGDFDRPVYPGWQLPRITPEEAARLDDLGGRIRLLGAYKGMVHAAGGLIREFRKRVSGEAVRDRFAPAPAAPEPKPTSDQDELEEPSDFDWECWRRWKSKEEKLFTQEKIAEQLAPDYPDERINQGRVSKACRRVRIWIQAEDMARKGGQP